MQKLQIKIEKLNNNHLYIKRYIFKFYQDLLFFYTKDYKKENLKENEYLNTIYDEYTQLINFSLKALFLNNYNQNEKIIEYVFNTDFDYLLEEIFFRSQSNLDLFPKNLEIIKKLLNNIFNNLYVKTLANDGWIDKEEFIDILNNYKKDFNKLNKEIKDILRDSKYIAKRNKKYKNRNLKLLNKKLKEIKNV